MQLYEIRFVLDDERFAKAAGEWRIWLLWRNRTQFGVTDPQFHQDVSFYVFTYPWWRFVLGFAFQPKILQAAQQAAKRNINKTIKDREGELEALTKDKDNAIASQEYEKAARLRDQEKELKKSIEEQKKKWLPRLATGEMIGAIDQPTQGVGSLVTLEPREHGHRHRRDEELGAQ